MQCSWQFQKRSMGPNVIFRAPKSSPPALIPPFRYSITPTLAALSHKSLVKACDLSWGCQAVEKGRRASAFLKEVKGWIPVLGRYIAGLSVFLSVCLSVYIWVTMQYSRNWHNSIQPLFFCKKKKKIKQNKTEPRTKILLCARVYSSLQDDVLGQKLKVGGPLRPINPIR